MNLSPSKIVRMDTNTSPYLPVSSLNALSRISREIRVNDYPDTSYLELRKKLSDYCNIGIDSFVIANGADEGLDIISKTLIDPGDEAIIPSPSYSMFRVTSEIMGANAILVQRKNDFGIDIEQIEKKTTDRTKIIFLCSPNNPTGNSVSREELDILLDSFSTQTIVIDEAYFEFSGKTYAKLTEKYDNLIIVRTFSKAFSMAGYELATSSLLKRLRINSTS